MSHVVSECTFGDAIAAALLRKWQNCTLWIGLENPPFTASLANMKAVLPFLVNLPYYRIIL